MVTMESKHQNPIPNSLPANTAGNSYNIPDLGDSLRSQLHNQGQSLPNPLSDSEMQADQLLLARNIQNNMTSAGAQRSMQQSNLLQSNQLQSSKHAIQQSTPSMLQQQQSVLRQQHHALIYQQQSQMMKQILLPSQQPQLRGQLPNAFPMQQIQLTGQRNHVSDLHQQQQVLGQQQQQLLTQLTNLSIMHQQQLDSENSVVLQQQQQFLSSQSRNCSLPANQLSVQMLQAREVPMMQQLQQSGRNLLATRALQSQPQQSLQQWMSQMQSPQTDLQPHPNPLQGDLWQRIQVSGQATVPFLQMQGITDLQRQLYQSQRTLPNTYPTSPYLEAKSREATGGNWQGQAYQKVKQTEEAYLPKSSEMYQKISAKSQQPHMQSMQQLKSQVPQGQSRESHMNTQQQSMNFQISTPRMPLNSVSSLQHYSLASISLASTSQQNTIKQIQSCSNMDSALGSPLGSVQPVASGYLQQNPLSTSQQFGISALSSQSGLSMLQQSIPIGSNSNMLLQNQHCKQNQEQKLRKQQLKKQAQRRQTQKQLLQQQQLHQQPKKQLHAKMQTQQAAMLRQMNNANEMKIQQGIGVKQEDFPQLSTSRLTLYPQKETTSGATYPVSSPYLLEAPPCQPLQQSSPEVDKQNLFSSLTKTGTPLQSAYSSSIVLPPSISLAPSPQPGDSEKPFSGTSSVSKVGNKEHQQMMAAQAPASSLATCAPEIPASPLLPEFTSADGAQGCALQTVSVSNVAEQPFMRLLKAVNSLSPKALSASVSDIFSVVSMMDRIAPGNGSRGAVGEDLVATYHQASYCVMQDGMTEKLKMKRYASAMTGPDTLDLEATGASGFKRPKIEAKLELMLEIRGINQQLIETVVNISDEDVGPIKTAAAAGGGEGTIVKCSFRAVALNPNLKLQYASAQIPLIQPLRLLLPANYPNCSPIELDKVKQVSQEYNDLSAKAKSKFSMSLRSLSQPMSLGEIARTWDICVRAIICEYAEQTGGGNFTSKYGMWENCLTTL